MNYFLSAKLVLILLLESQALNMGEWNSFKPHMGVQEGLSCTCSLNKDPDNPWQSTTTTCETTYFSITACAAVIEDTNIMSNYCATPPSHYIKHNKIFI